MLVIDKINHLLLKLRHLEQLLKTRQHMHRHLPIRIVYELYRKFLDDDELP